jgi:predicted acylesterase/phospholipase RssA
MTQSDFNPVALAPQIEETHTGEELTPISGKTALVLAGGGILGAVYEIGALRAVNDMLVNKSVNDFDIFVGTSAGSLVSAMLANGMSPSEMMQAIDDTHPEVRGIASRDIFQINLLEFVTRLPRLPGVLWRNGRQLIPLTGDRSLIRLIWDLSALLPTGLYSSRALERYVEEVLTRPGCLNRFDHLEKDLYIIATDLDSGERTVLGKGGKGVIPISKAVAASSAIPVLYKPVRIFGKEYVDGSLRGTASLDLAVESGAKLVVCINPLVPLNAKQLYGEDEHIGDEGVRTILNQVIRIVMHAGLRYHIKSLQRQHPDVDFILIEPQPDDQKMFDYDLMDYGNRLRAAEHGFESVTMALLERYPQIKRTLRRHGIEITRRWVTEELAEIRQSDYDPEVMRHVFDLDEEPSTPPSAPRVPLVPLPIDQSMASFEDRLSKLDRLLNQSPAPSKVPETP